MLTDYLKKFVPVLWLLPGLLLWAAFPPLGERADVVLAMAPILWLGRRQESRVAAKKCFAIGLAFWLATLSWMTAIVKNGGPWPLVVLGWGALAVYCAAYFAAYGFLSAKIWQWARRGAYGRRLLAIILLEPVLWCGLELIRSRLFGGFSWNQLGVVAVNSGLGAPAAWGGVYLCSAMIVIVAGSITGIFERMWRPALSGFPALRRWGSVETLLALGVVLAVYGFSSSAEKTGNETQILKVAMVQRNFPCVFKGAMRENPIAAYSNLLTKVALMESDLVVMSESALAEFGAIGSRRAAEFAGWALDTAKARALLAGGNRMAAGKAFNSAALYDFSDRRRPRMLSYDKVHLVPFGEFIPGDKLFPALQKLAPVGSCTPGDLRLLPLSTSTFSLQLGCAICYEDTDSAQMRSLAKMGAGVLLFITNDSWFSRSVEAEQHAWQAVARAIETGLPVVRVGNSGVTGTITPNGKASWLVGPDGAPLVDLKGTMFDKVEVRGEGGQRTVYIVFGDWPLGIAFALLIFVMIVVKYFSTYEKRRKLSL